jgi:hypothetical protein
MHNALRKDQVSVEEIQSLAEFLVHMKEEQNNDYLDSLIRPEITKGSKIPTTIPVPSSSFQLHSSATFSPNSLGHAAIVFNPFFLSSNTSVNPPSTMYLNNNAALTGGASSNFFLALDIGQVIPAVYNEYRLVSASVVIRYIGRLDIVQGVIGGAIVFDNNVSNTAVDGVTVNAAIAKYGNFNLAQDSYYFQENMTLNGIRELYFPLDTTYEQYRQMSTTINDPKTGFAFVIYLQDGVYQLGAPNYKVDIYCNYECLPDATFLNYIPTQTSTPQSETNKGEAIRNVQLNAITNGEIPRTSNQESKPSFWERIKSGLGNILPSIANLASGLIPGGKLIGPAFQAASSLFSGNSSMGPNSNAISILNPSGGKQNLNASMNTSFLDNLLN